MDQRVRAMGLDVQNFVSPVLLTGRGVRAFCSHLTGLSRCQRFLPLAARSAVRPVWKAPQVVSSSHRVSSRFPLQQQRTAAPMAW
jgi:hypothetical protein